MTFEDKRQERVERGGIYRMGFDGREKNKNMYKKSGWLNNMFYCLNVTNMQFQIIHEIRIFYLKQVCSPEYSTSLGFR